MKSPQARLRDRVGSIAYEDEAPLDRQLSKGRFGRLGSPPMSPEHEAHSSKFRRHGSKLMSVLRSFTNGGEYQMSKYMINADHSSIVPHASEYAEPGTISPPIQQRTLAENYLLLWVKDSSNQRLFIEHSSRVDRVWFRLTKGSSILPLRVHLLQAPANTVVASRQFLDWQNRLRRALSTPNRPQSLRSSLKFDRE